MADTYDVILRLVQNVQKDEASIGVLSTGERLAVALVLDRKGSARRVRLHHAGGGRPGWTGLAQGGAQGAARLVLSARPKRRNGTRNPRSPRVLHQGSWEPSF